METMDDHTDNTPNAKVILLATGGAALAALLIALARRREEDEQPQEKVEAVGRAAKKEAKKAAKAAAKKQKVLAAVIEHDAQTAERELKAAAWDAQQRAREAESRLRAAGLRVVDDAAQLASKVGSEARSLAGEGKEKIAHLRHRETEEHGLEAEIRRLREELESLKRQMGRESGGPARDVSRLVSLLGRKGSPVADAVSSPAIAAALTQMERSLRTKAPALAAAKNKGEVLEILMQDLGPTMRDAGLQAVAAALGMLESARGEEGRAKEALEEARDTARKSSEESRRKMEDVTAELHAAAEEAAAQAEGIAANGKRRFWKGRSADHAEAAVAATAEAAETAQQESEEHHGKAALFWGGAAIGLALYALLDAERRENVLRLANDASVQIQELVRDMQGYDDEF
jgi:hypothetical protein